MLIFELLVLLHLFLFSLPTVRPPYVSSREESDLRHRPSLCTLSEWQTFLVQPFGTGRWQCPNTGCYSHVWWQQFSEEELKRSDRKALGIKNWSMVLWFKLYTLVLTQINNSNVCPWVWCQCRTQPFLNGQWRCLANDKGLKWNKSFHWITSRIYMLWDVFLSLVAWLVNCLDGWFVEKWLWVCGFSTSASKVLDYRCAPALLTTLRSSNLNKSYFSSFRLICIWSARPCTQCFIIFSKWLDRSCVIRSGKYDI